MENAGLEIDSLLRNYNDNQHFAIKLHLNNLKWLKFYKLMRGNKFPKQVISYEITIIDPNFINKTRKSYMVNGEYDEV